MAIVAALLACVTMFSHRAHNETLQRQGEANRLQTEANILHTRATDQWGFYQAKNVRAHQYRASLDLLAVLAKDGSGAGRLAEVEREWRKQLVKYDQELPTIQKEAQELVHQGEEKQHQCQEKLEESEAAHHRGDRFDLAELAVELALVLCSVSILTKQSVFWYCGVVVSAIGAAIALSVFLLH